MNGFLLTGLALWGLTAPGDTTVTLRRGDVVVVEGASGDLIVRAWERSELRVTGDEDAGSVGVVRSGSTVRVTSEDRKGRRRSYDMTLWVPTWADLQVRGRSLDVSVTGVSGSVDVSTLDGEVSLTGTGGAVAVHTVEGEITIREASGRVFANSEGDDIRLEDVRGPVEVTSGSGDVDLLRVDGAMVRAETLDGDIVFDGELHSGGVYSFNVHDGDVRLVLARDVGASFSVSTFDGDFTTEFPVTIQRFSGGRAFDFVLGDGGAQVRIEVFDGEIRLQTRR